MEDRMKPETVSILRSPRNGELLELIREAGSGNPLLVGRSSGERFAIRDGIPDFIQTEAIDGMNQKYQRLYNRLAPFYDAITHTFAAIKSGGEEQRVREYLRELEINPGDRVLETSIGTGRSLHFLPRSAHYYGIDISLGMLKQCLRKSRRLGWEVELFLCPAERLCFQDCAFEVVYQVGGINYFNDPGAAIREMIRVARPGAKMIIVDETEDLARKYASAPAGGEFYKNHGKVIHSPADLVPEEMQDVTMKTIANGDLYCLIFRKPA
jgi:ubiquinone/menaquinone biosynthesis C-methylase UbiE